MVGGEYCVGTGRTGFWGLLLGEGLDNRNFRELGFRFRHNDWGDERVNL